MPAKSPLCDRDFFAAEEIDSTGRTEKRELINRLSVLLLHLLKWRYRREKRSPS